MTSKSSIVDYPIFLFLFDSLSTLSTCESVGYLFKESYCFSAMKSSDIKFIY